MRQVTAGGFTQIFLLSRAQNASRFYEERGLGLSQLLLKAYVRATNTLQPQVPVLTTFCSKKRHFPLIHRN